MEKAKPFPDQSQLGISRASSAAAIRESRHSTGGQEIECPEGRRLSSDAGGKRGEKKRGGGQEEKEGGCGKVKLALKEQKTRRKKRPWPATRRRRVSVVGVNGKVNGRGLG